MGMYKKIQNAHPVVVTEQLGKELEEVRLSITVNPVGTISK